MSTTTELDDALTSLRLEHDAVFLYDALARIEKDPARADLFRGIADNDRRHAQVWAARVTELGGSVPPPPRRPGLRVRYITLNARLFGTRRVAEMVRAIEYKEELAYDRGEMTAEIRAMAVDERAHAAAWTSLEQGTPPSADAIATAIPQPAGVTAGVVRTPVEIARGERWHQGGAGTLRAVVFGASDGLVSNLSLVMGVAGAASDRPSFILLSGIAGLLAGAFSMAAGEYISVQSQREVLQRQIALERAEIDAFPEEEKAQLVGIYMAKGLPEEDARRVADHIFADRGRALDTLVREELGLDPDELGNPWAAAGGSFISFSIGAVIPVIPYLFGGGMAILLISFGASLVGLFTVGALVSLLTGRSTLYSGFRQVGIGAVAAIVTFLVGTLIGVSVA